MAHQAAQQQGCQQVVDGGAHAARQLQQLLRWDKACDHAQKSAGHRGAPQLPGALLPAAARTRPRIPGEGILPFLRPGPLAGIQHHAAGFHALAGAQIQIFRRQGDKEDGGAVTVREGVEHLQRCAALVHPQAKKETPALGEVERQHGVARILLYLGTFLLTFQVIPKQASSQPVAKERHPADGRVQRALHERVVDVL